jgi:hypothetical protein
MNLSCIPGITQGEKIVQNAFMAMSIAVLLFQLPMGAQSSGASESENKGISLIQEEGMKGWRGDHGTWMNVGKAIAALDGSKRIDTEPGNGILVNGPDGHTKNLFSEMEHADVEAEIEFMVPPTSNSGIYFQGRYEIQILDSWGVEELHHGDCGGIYQRWKDDKGYEGHPPRVNASRKPGEWQSFHVIFRAPRFDEDGNKVENARFVKVVHNGQVVHENVEVTGPTRAAVFEDEKPTGPLMIQGDHGPVALRRLVILDLTP